MIWTANVRQDKYVELVKELISREEKPAPEFRLNPDISDFYDFTRNDVELIGYEHGEQIEIPVAV